MIIPRPSTNIEPDDLPMERPKGPTKAYIDYLFNLPTWQCSTCKTKMFGTCTYCVYCWLKTRVRRERP